MEQSEDPEGKGGRHAASEEWSDDLGVASDIEALVAAVEAGEDLNGEPLASASDSAMNAVVLDDADFEELEAEAEPLSLYLDIDGTVVEVAQDRFVIGRASKLCDFAIVDVNISRQHCVIERREDGHYLIDQGSINGVKVGGKRVDNFRLSDGDVLELAGHTVRVRYGPAAPPEDDFDLTPEPEPSPARAEVEVKTTAPYDAVPMEEYPEDGAETPPRGQRLPYAQPSAQPAHRVDTVVPTTAPAPAYDAPVAAPAGQRVDTVVPTTAPAQTFEERVEQRLEQLTHQVASLQAGIQALLDGFAQIQDAAAVAKVIRERLGR